MPRSAVHHGRVTVRGAADLDLIGVLEASNPDREACWRPVSESVWWLARNEHGDVLGYAAARMWSPKVGYLAWARVLPFARGAGLQRRLIRARVAWCRAQGAQHVVTYTAPDNAASMRSLIACGFRPYLPEHPWVGSEWVYWKRAV
jgi:GNAT superfamily N-acetyltransferase